MKTLEGNPDPGILVESVLSQEDFVAPGPTQEDFVAPGLTQKISLPLVSPMFGKVAPPVDHHPTHLAISRAAKCKREVEQCQLVTVAHTLASGENERFLSF